jgi:hypothetical protein
LYWKNGRKATDQGNTTPVDTAWVPIKKDHIPSTALKGSTSLPDFGKTSVEVDKIHLEPKKTKWRRQDLFGSSIVKQTLQELEDDGEFQATKREIKKHWTRGNVKGGTYKATQGVG